MVPVPCVGPFGTAVERVGTFYYSRKQKREILGDAGLQHVPDCPTPFSFTVTVHAGGLRPRVYRQH